MTNWAAVQWAVGSVGKGTAMGLGLARLGCLSGSIGGRHLLIFDITLVINKFIYSRLKFYYNNFDI
jgi:hypothetical protein